MKLVSVYLSDEQAAQLDQAAQQELMSMSALARRAIMAHIGRFIVSALPEQGNSVQSDGTPAQPAEKAA